MKKTTSQKANKINLLNFKSVPMRTFHLTWMAFFLCFFGWFGVAPMMGVIREELGLSKSEIGNIIIASVSVTVIARLCIGWLCDKIGPRITYTVLLLVGAFPVGMIGLADSYASFLIFRLVIGVIGASFVITQYHTSMMFAPNVVGTANATTAGWGNMGGGVTQMVMPLVLAAFVALGYSEAVSWRLAMVVPGIAMFVFGILYYILTQDTPEGNFKELRKNDPNYAARKKQSSAAIKSAIKDYRVWLLFLAYAACFGIELSVNNVAALYYQDRFELSLTSAGLIAGLFGLMNLFARSLGGFFGDKMGVKHGLKGRVLFLFVVLLIEGIALIIFRRMEMLPVAIATMIIFSLFVQMSEGATFSVVPFVNKKAIGTISGIVGAGGNVGAVAAGFLFKAEGISYSTAFLLMGGAVTIISFASLAIKFSMVDEKETQAEISKSIGSNPELKPAL